MRKAFCQLGNHNPETLLATFFLNSSGGIQLNNDGTSNNYWYDGTFGVPQEVVDEADIDGAYCYDKDCPGYLKEVIWLDYLGKG